MKVVVAPWFKSSTGFSLRVYGERWKYCEADCLAEISTFKGQRIALALLQAYANSLKLSTFNVERSLRMAVEVELQDEVAERLLFSLRKLGEVPASSEIPKRLVERPSLEELERFLILRKLLGK